MTTEPLWSDKKIEEEVRGLEEYIDRTTVDGDDVIPLMQQMRDEYEQQLSRLRAELAAAKRWQPVEEGEIKGTWQQWTIWRDNHLNTRIEYIENDGEPSSVWLPYTMQVMRSLTPADSEKEQSHE